MRASRPSRAAVLAICFAAVVFDGYDLIVYGVTLPSMMAHDTWGLTPAQAGAIGSYALVGMFVGAVASGAATDRFGRRKTLIACIAWFSLATMLAGLAPSPQVFGLMRFLAGLGFGGVVPTAIALAVEWSPERYRSRCNALVLTGFPLGGLVATFLALWIIPEYGFRTMYLIGGLPLVTLVPAALILLPESPGFSARRTAHLGDRLRKTTGVRARHTGRGRALLAVTVFSLANFCGMLLVYGLNTWLPQIMRSAGHSLGSSLMFLAVLNIGAVLGGLAGAAVADRVGPRPTTVGAFACATLAITALAWPLPAPLPHLFVAAAGATTIGTQMLLFGWVATHFPAHQRGAMLGVATGVGRLGAVCGPLLGGLLIGLDTGPGPIFATLGAVAVAAALILLAVPRPRDTRPRDVEPVTATGTAR